MKKFCVLLSLLAAVISLSASGIAGLVQTSEGAGLPFVTVSLLRPDSSLVTGTISGDDGSFRLVLSPSSGKEKYILKASYIGYETQCVNLSGAKDSLIIRLHEESEQLAEVVVLQKAPLVERRMDKIVMNVASSPFAVGNNGKDILKKARRTPPSLAKFCKMANSSSRRTARHTTHLATWCVNPHCKEKHNAIFGIAFCSEVSK